MQSVFGMLAFIHLLLGEKNNTWLKLFLLIQKAGSQFKLMADTKYAAD